VVAAVKVKNFERSNYVAVGRVWDQGRRDELLLAEESSEGLRFVGRAFNVLRGPAREQLTAAIDSMVRSTAPIGGLRARNATWTTPRLRVSVRHLATTGALRHATAEALVEQR
jgi:ATP-dependent DNA ligase